MCINVWQVSCYTGRASDPGAPCTLVQEADGVSAAQASHLAQENEQLRAQIQKLNARLAQHAQRAEQLLAGTEPFFGSLAGSLIGQPVEEEDEGDSRADSDSGESFTSARERALSRPLSAASSFHSAHSAGFSAAQSGSLTVSGSVSPVKRGARGASKATGGAGPAASFDSAQEEVLSQQADGGRAAQPAGCHSSSEGMLHAGLYLQCTSRIGCPKYP